MTTDTARTDTARITERGPRTIRTQSGSLYRVDGTTVHKLSEDGSATRFDLVDVHKNRLRYTDGARLYISTPLVAA